MRALWFSIWVAPILVGGLCFAQNPNSSNDVQYRSAVVFRVEPSLLNRELLMVDRRDPHRPVTLPFFDARKMLPLLQRGGCTVFSADDKGISYKLAADSTSAVTITPRGTICVRGLKPLVDLAAVDELNSTVAASIGLLDATRGLPDFLGGNSWFRSQAWMERRYYSNPQTLQLLFFSNAAEALRPVGGRLTVQTVSRLPAVMTAGVRVPTMAIAAARLQVWGHIKPAGDTVMGGIGPGNVPWVWLDSLLVVQGGTASYGYQTVTPVFTPGDHQLRIATQLNMTAEIQNRTWLTPSDFLLEIVTTEPTDDRVEVLMRGEVLKSRVCDDWDSLTNDWDDLPAEIGG
jgi:hypothetical protein